MLPRVAQEGTPASSTPSIGVLDVSGEGGPVESVMLRPVHGKIKSPVRRARRAPSPADALLLADPFFAEVCDERSDALREAFDASVIAAALAARTVMVSA